MRSAEQGAALLSVLLTLAIVGAITLAMMAVVQADLAAGIRQEQAVRVFNVGEAGIHYAIARLQQSGAATYTGEERDIIDSQTGTVGHVSLVVRCVDGASPSVNSCSGPNAGYRRITSTGTLAVSGPVRVVTAVVEGTTSATSNYAICGYNGINFDQGVEVYGDVGSNAGITVARGGTPSKICNSVAGGACTGPGSPPSEPYSGSAYAVGTITCGGGACNSSQIEGTIAPNQPAGSVCPTVTLTPPSGPGTVLLVVPAATTITVDPTINYGAVALASTGTSTCPSPASLRATLTIDSGSDPNATVTVRMRSLYVGKCARVVITGTGKVALWLLEPSATPASGAGQALKAEQLSIFGSTSTGETPAAISGERFIINVLSNKPLADAGNCLNLTDSNCAAVHFNQSGLISGTFLVPDGGFELDQAQLTNGALLAGQIQFDRNTTFTWDPDSSIGGGTYSNFNRLKAWKDQ